jgi:glutaredoxin
MGRITIFSADDCHHCDRLYAVLKAYSLPYTKISITQYPAKRGDMLSLSMRRSTPQVFFNTRHVGGADETIKLLQKWERSTKLNRHKSSDASRSSASILSVSSSKNDLDKSSSNIAEEASTTSVEICGHEKLIQQTVFDRFYAEVGKYPDPKDNRFSIPDYPPIIPEPSPPRVEKIILPDRSETTVFHLTEMLKNMFPPEDVTQGVKTHKRSFREGDAIEKLQQKFAITAAEAANFCDILLEKKIIHRLCTSGGSCIYRLQCWHLPLILNSYRVWTERVDTNSLRMLRQLSKLGVSVERSAADNQGSINLQEVSKSSLYAEFEEALCELQGVDLKDMDNSTKIVSALTQFLTLFVMLKPRSSLDHFQNFLQAFGVNLYNLMVKYAFMKVGVPTNSSSQADFLDNVKFILGGHVYSLNDWKHGFLRGNACLPNSRKRPFGKMDPRLQLVVKKPDARVHFCINSGSKSCPPVLFLSADHLEEELALIAASFCEDDQNVQLIPSKNEIRLSKIFQWYRSDFVSDSNELPVLLSSYMHGVRKQTLERMQQNKSLNVSYLESSWNLHFKSFNEYTRESLHNKKKPMFRLPGKKHSFKLYKLISR